MVVPGTVNIKDTDLKATKRHASAFGNPELGPCSRSKDATPW